MPPKRKKLNFLTTELPWLQSKSDLEVSRNAQASGLLDPTTLKTRLKPAAKNLAAKYKSLSTAERLALAKKSMPHSEIVLVRDLNGKTITDVNPLAGAMSGADPVGEFVVGTVGGNLGFGLGKLALSKMGQNSLSHWARNSLLNEATKDLTRNISNDALANTFGNLTSKYTTLGDNPILQKLPLYENTLNQIVSLNSPEAINYSLNMVRKSPNFKEIIPYLSKNHYYNGLVENHGQLEANNFLKLWGDEIIRRAEAMGNNMQELQPIFLEGNTVIGTPSTLIKKQVSKPVSVVSSDAVPINVGGWHSNNEIAVRLTGRETPLSIISTLLHETAQHGTDDIISSLPKNAVDTYYLPFVDKVQYLDDIRPGSKNWQELRATVGELAAQLYKTMNRGLNGEVTKSGSLGNYAEMFNKAVDNMPDNVLIENLSNINGYGKDYAKFLSLNPKYIKEYKNMLKHAPSVSVPIGISLPILNNSNK